MHKKGLLALSPLVVFLAVYVVTSAVAGDFYRVPVSSAFLIASVYSILISRRPIRENLSIFSRGAGNPNLLLMIWIFILAGAFTSTAKSIGAVDATVNFTLNIFPPGALYIGLFLTSCFISTAMGTSVGTIVALVPLGVGVAGKLGISLPMMSGLIVGGAFFGDNLSFISDTTIAATRAAGCEMKDKFFANFRIVLPAVVIVSVIYLIKGWTVTSSCPVESVQYIKLIPYISVIVLSLVGLDVTVVLSIGILENFVIGLSYGNLGWVSFLESSGAGVSSMSDLIIVTLLAGGLLEMISSAGGLEYLTDVLTRHVKGPVGAQFSIAALVSLANLCTANNTIAIITTGGIANSITQTFGISPKRTASILDTFSCIVQSFIPYGAQLLMASSLADISPASIIPYLYYSFALLVCAIAAVPLCRN